MTEVKRIRGKKRPLTATGLHTLRAEFTCSAGKEEG